MRKYEIQNNQKSEANHEVFMLPWPSEHLFPNLTECNVKTVKSCGTKNLC